MQFDDLINSMNRETYDRLVTAVETGRWPDGNKLSDEQRENSLQLVMAYQAKFIPSDQHMSIGKDGNMLMKSKRDLKQQFAEQPEQSIARFTLDDSSSKND
ncbi:MAG: YeaC family protein [Pseudomonadota bacterium]